MGGVMINTCTAESQTEGYSRMLYLLEFVACTIRDESLLIQSTPLKIIAQETHSAGFAYLTIYIPFSAPPGSS
jgi:hypothetical protein